MTDYQTDEGLMHIKGHIGQWNSIPNEIAQKLAMMKAKAAIFRCGNVPMMFLSFVFLMVGSVGRCQSPDSTARSADSTGRFADSTLRPANSAARLADSTGRPANSTMRPADATERPRRYHVNY